MKPTIYRLAALIVVVGLLFGLIEFFSSTSITQDFGSTKNFPLSLREKRPTVLLVHGYPTQAILSKNYAADDHCTATAEPWRPEIGKDFENLPQWLISDGYDDVRVAHYQSGPSGTPSIETLATCLREQVLNAAHESATGDIVIVAYSLGGLVTRAYLESDQYKQDGATADHPLVSSVFLVGTPNQGMPFNGFINLLFDCSNVASVQRAACQFTSTGLMKEFNAKYPLRAPNADYYLIGGVHYGRMLGILMGTYICAVMGPNDGTVPTMSATALEGVRQAVTVYASHLSVVGDPAYFGPDSDSSHSAAYMNCIRPVLVEGNLDGCQSSAPQACEASSFGIGVLIVGLFATGLGGLALKVANRRKTKRVRTAL